MARPRLAVWLHGDRVADIEARSFADLRLRHTNEALAKWPANAPIVSCSLPVSRTWQPATSYLRGLLPEGRHLLAAAQAANVASSNTYGLLARYGRDVAGAIVITRHDEMPDQTRWGVEPYTVESLAEAVAGLEDGDVVYPDSELSIAGLQNKLLLVATPDGWARPIGGEPSTHILKVDDPIRHGLVAAEFHALVLAGAIGAGDSRAQLVTIAGRQCLVVRRFDRVDGPTGNVVRVHQEDACQALGIDHEARGGRGKYEAAGGPALRDVARLLETYAGDPVRELSALVRLMTFTVAIGNADAHGKNIAVLHDIDGTIRLAPAYDTVPTMLWPNLRTRPGMYIDGIDDLTEIGRNALNHEANRWGLTASESSEAVDMSLDRLRTAAETIEHQAFGELVHTNLARIDTLS